LQDAEKNTRILFGSKSSKFQDSIRVSKPSNVVYVLIENYIEMKGLPNPPVETNLVKFGWMSNVSGRKLSYRGLLEHLCSSIVERWAFELERALLNPLCPKHVV
jgi:hypothetical protein